MSPFCSFPLNFSPEKKDAKTGGTLKCPFYSSESIDSNRSGSWKSLMALVNQKIY